MPTPYIDTKNVKKVMEYRKKGLTVKEISLLLQRDYKTVYRWYSFGMGSKKYLKRVDQRPGKNGKLSTR